MLNLLWLLDQVRGMKDGGSAQRPGNYYRHCPGNKQDPLCDRAANSDSSDFEQGITSAGFVKGTNGSRFGQTSNNIGYGQRLGSLGLGLGENGLESNRGSGHEGIKKSAYIAEIEARSKIESEMNHQMSKENVFEREQGNMLSGDDWRETPNSHEALSWQKHQEWKDVQRFQNAENFENFRHYQNYREPQPFNEIKHEEYPPFSKGLELKFTNLTTTARIANYSKIFSASKIFIIETKEDSTAHINLISLTKHYHPQFRVYERIGNGYVLMQNINFNNKYFFSHSGFYVLEIGTDSNIDVEPFEDIRNGAFVCCVSSEMRTIEEIMNDEEIKVSMWGYEGYIPFTQNSDLSLFHTSWKYLSHGICDYQITPCYDSSNKSLSIFYHKGSSEKIGHIMRASTVEIKCNRNLPHPNLFYGKELKQAMYHFDVESKRICDLFDLIDTYKN